MSHLIIAKLIPDKFESLGSEKTDAQNAARSLFGYEVGNVKHEPTAEITFDLVHSFQRTETSVGWMALLDDENHARFNTFLAANTAFADLFEIEQIPLNEDKTTREVYCNTSPLSAEDCWGARGGP
jgi:hypothetical protein